jgi:hypothetical protein
MAYLTEVSSRRGKNEEAEVVHREVLVVRERERVLGKEHLDKLTSMNNLAYRLASQSIFVEASTPVRQGHTWLSEGPWPTPPPLDANRTMLACLMKCMRRMSHRGVLETADATATLFAR